MTMDFPFPQLTGDIHVNTYLDVDGDRNTVLEINRHWYIQPHWWVDGAGATDLGGTWHVSVIVESMGRGVEKTLKTVDIPITDLAPLPRAHTLEYHPWIHIPSRLENVDESIPEDGAYKLVILVTYTNQFGTHGRMAGFVEGPLLQFYHFEDR